MLRLNTGLLDKILVRLGKHFPVNISNVIPDHIGSILLEFHARTKPARIMLSMKKTIGKNLGYPF